MQRLTRVLPRLGIPVLVLIAIIVAAGLGGSYVYFRMTNGSLPVDTSGWQTYHSTASSAHFAYPPNWHIVSTTLGIAQPVWLLENVSIAGPNSFVLTFQVQKVHAMAALLCARTYDSAPITLNNTYSMVVEGRDTQSITTAYLVDKASAGMSGYSCGRGYSMNMINSTTGFVFYGSYTNQASQASGMTEAAYENAPEVVTAKAIFASFSL